MASSGSTNGNPGGSGGGAGGSNITDLVGELKQLQDSGPADVKLSEATRDAYLNIIKTFRDQLNDQLTAIGKLGSLGSPGSLGSANETKTNLEMDISGLGGIEQSITQYLSYLDQFSTTVKKAADRLLQSG
ncbi:hypothetical protein OK015_07830 [Mycobacterium sp. Aquia_216]|uniref:hypothetical protein n=1 Tax=Mycobacterium sp. Aquia_216 TaxID=2991729 RepID=UPI00227A1F69|nr:hypothetical protein [Mycobacterium sp. Aquia_216]WAJ46366.1 hypothetical protein OK015_07830 [Mycobacterium sp. Aquia_216]